MPEPAAHPPPRGCADLVLRGGSLYLPGAAAGRPGSVAVAGGRIAFVGPDADVADRTGPRTEVVDVQGRMVLPGFHDAHVHPLLGGLALLECRLTGAATREACLERVADYALRHPELPAIRGGGWTYGAFPPGGPQKADLDRVAPDRPVALAASDGHSLWVNSKALALAGITALTRDPPGGRIERDERTGEPAGTLREWAAMELVTRCLPPAPRDLLLRAGREFLAMAARFGITSVCEAMATPDLLEAYAALDAAGELTLRVNAALLCKPEKSLDGLAELENLRRAYARPRLRPLAAKLFLDGVIDSHTAFLLEPYADRPGGRGEPLWPQPELLRMAAALDRTGFQIHAHAIGDAAVRMALDAFAWARRVNGPRDSRHQIAHLDLLDASDLPRFRELGVTADLQPAWFHADAAYTDSMLPFLGPGRGTNLYRMQELIEAGATVACGSDWPFGGDEVTCDPLMAIRIGATRRSPSAGAGVAPLPGRVVRPADLLDAFTRGGAIAGFLEGEAGSLEPEKRADVIVLDRDILRCPAGEIHEARVLLTLFEGRAVFRDDAL